MPYKSKEVVVTTTPAKIIDKGEFAFGSYVYFQAGAGVSCFIGGDNTVDANNGTLVPNSSSAVGIGGPPTPMRIGGCDIWARTGVGSSSLRVSGITGPFEGGGR